MTTAAKFVIGVLLILAGGYGSSYLMDKGMPEYKTILTPVSSKFGEDYKSYFIDPTYEKNDAWWEWSYKYRWLVDLADATTKTKLSDDFKEEKVSSGYSNSDAKSLNKICGEAYNKGESDIKGVSNYEKDIWRYCSIGGYKPKTLDEDSYDVSGTANILGKSKKGSLISTRESGTGINDWFWDLKNIEFYGLDGSTPKGSQEANNSYFRKFYDDNKHRWKGRENIKKRCDEAYKLEASSTSSSDKPKEDEVFKFCSLKGKQ